ncbi:unnamed protein product, partial [Vitis vinifera]
MVHGQILTNDTNQLRNHHMSSISSNYHHYSQKCHQTYSLVVGHNRKFCLPAPTKPTPENHFRVGESLSLQGLPKTFKNPHSPSTITQTVMSSESEISANFWGDMPEEEYYASQGVRNTKSYFDTPNGKLFTQSFLPLDLPVKASVYMTHGYGSDTGWLFQKICINYATWGYAVFAADILGLIFSAPLFVMPENMKPSKVRLFLYGLLFGMADTWATMPDNKMVGKAIKDPEKLKVIASNPRRYTGPPRVGTMRELARVCQYIQDNFSKVTAPFLTVHGTADGVTCPTSSKLLYEKASSEDKALKLYEGMYHSLIQGEPDENANLVLKDMREWIDERVERYGPSKS